MSLGVFCGREFFFGSFSLRAFFLLALVVGFAAAGGFLRPEVARAQAGSAFQSVSGGGRGDRVFMRSGRHQGYARLVLDFAVLPPYRLEQSGRRLVLDLDSDYRIEGRENLTQIADYVTLVRKSGNAIMMSLNGDFFVDSFPINDSIVIDVRDAPPPQARSSVFTNVAPARESARAPPPQSRPPGAASTPSTLVVRSGRHPDYDRIVFEIGRNQAYEAELSADNLLSVTFGRNFSADLDALNANFEDIINGPARLQGGVFTLSLNRPRELRSFRLADKAVIDLLHSREEAEASSDEAVTVRFGLTRDYSRFVFDWQRPVNYIANNDGETIRITFNASNPLDLSSVDLPSDAPYGEPSQSLLSGSVRFILPVEPDLPWRHFRAGNRVLIDLLTSENPTPRFDDFGGSAGEEGLRRTLAERQDEQVRRQLSPAPVESPLFRVTVPVLDDSHVGAFRRGQYYWLIFTGTSSVDKEALRRSSGGAFSAVEQFDYADYTVLRFSLAVEEPVWTVVSRNGFFVDLDFYGSLPSVQEERIGMSIQTSPDYGEVLSIRASRAGPVVAVSDPGLEDTVLVGLVGRVNDGVRRPRAFPEFQVLASEQGVVIDPFKETVSMRRTVQGFEVFNPEGLQLSPTAFESLLLARRDVLDGTGLLSFESWDNSVDFREVERDLFLRVVARSDEARLDGGGGSLFEARRVEDELALAGYYLSQGLGYEALGVLGPVGMEDYPPWHMARLAAMILVGRVDEALPLLESSRYVRFREGQLWRAVALAQQGQLQLAEEGFVSAGDLLDNYPESLRLRLGVWRLEAALASGNVPVASDWLERLGRLSPGSDRSFQQGLVFYRARRLELSGGELEALQLYRGLERTGESFWSVRSLLARLRLESRRDELDVRSTIADLEHARFLWRGDGVEHGILTALGRLYIESDDYRRGLSVFRGTLTKYPDSPISQDLAHDMVLAFQRVFLDEESSGVLSAVEAYELYRRFRELTPPGREGNRLVESLVDRLASIGAYDLAATLLDEEINRRRVSGLDGLRLGIKGALLLVLDDRSGEAVRALEGMVVGAEVNQYVRDRRLLLSKAWLDEGRGDVAVRLLSGDVSEEASLLRIEHYQRSRDWGQVAESYRLLVGSPPVNLGLRYGGSRGGWLVSWALALYLDGDEEGLRALSRRYGVFVEGTALESVLAFITDAERVGGEVDTGELLRRLEESGGSVSFLDRFESRYFREPVLRAESEPEPAPEPEPEPEPAPETEQA